MNTKYSAAIIALMIMMTAGSAIAQTKTTTSPTSTASGSASTSEEQSIQNIKNKVADKVAEIRKKDLRALAGPLISTGSALQIQTADSTVYDIKIDDGLTKSYLIQGVSKKEVKPSTYKKNAYLIASGPIIDKTINANVIYQDEEFIVKSGKITEVNKTDYIVKLLSSDKDSYSLSIETSTKQLMLNIKTHAIEATGFSKIKEGDSIHFVAKKTGTEKEKNTYAATRILIVPQEYFIK